MADKRIDSVAALEAGIRGYTAANLLEEAKFTFGYYGNAAHNGQVERKDDAIERFNVVLAELARRLNTGGGETVQEIDEGKVDLGCSGSADQGPVGGGVKCQAKVDGAGEGWVLLSDGDLLQKGDGFRHPDHDGWIDYVCRPDIFRGENERVHGGWVWRRKADKMAVIA